MSSGDATVRSSRLSRETTCCDLVTGGKLQVGLVETDSQHGGRAVDGSRRGGASGAERARGPEKLLPPDRPRHKCG